MLPIHILGTGAMACLWASYFSEQHHINFIRRTNSTSQFSFRLMPSKQVVAGNSYTAKSVPHSIQHLIVATKAFDAQAAIQSVEHLLSPNAQIVLLQNGMGSQQSIAKQFSQYAVYACSSTEGAYKIDPHTLMHAGKGINHIGSLSGEAQQQKLAQWLPTSSFQWHEDISPVLWRKLIVNCAINPLTLIYNCQNGELIKQPHMQQHMKDICQELDMLLDKMPFDFPCAIQLATQICQQTANNFSSMYQDGKHNKPTEIDFITGYIVKKCQEFSLPCPENIKLINSIKKLNLGP
jgi:2-dehydropantoate 2-reductase